MTQDEQWLLKEKYDGQQNEAFFDDCVRLKNGEPLAYLIGTIPFLGTTIHLSSHPLIPRTETEYWVEKVIKEIENNQGRTLVRILDMCAGSGCIGVAILKAIPNAVVDFVELETCHHETILQNVNANDIDPSRTNICGGDLFEEIHTTYDYIFTNPPYIDASLGRTDVSVQTFEPSMALYGGTRGMEIISRIIEESGNYLNENGTLVIEHEPEQSEEIAQLAKSKNFASITLPDQFGVLRYTTLTRTN